MSISSASRPGVYGLFRELRDPSHGKTDAAWAFPWFCLSLFFVALLKRPFRCFFVVFGRGGLLKQIQVAELDVFVLVYHLWCPADVGFFPEQNGVVFKLTGLRENRSIVNLYFSRKLRDLVFVRSAAICCFAYILFL